MAAMVNVRRALQRWGRERPQTPGSFGALQRWGRERPQTPGSFGALSALLVAAPLLAGCEQAHGSAPAPAATASAQAQTAKEEDEPLGRLSVPDVTLTNQRGEPVRLPDLLGSKPAVVSFIFTRCTTICPPI